MTKKITCQALRQDQSWVAHIPQYGVYGHGTTLAALRENLKQGLALTGVSAQITLVAVTKELEALRAAEQAYSAALRRAVLSLSRQQAPSRDIAQATGAPPGEVRALLDKAAARREVRDSHLAQ
ncbi:hypothetical protein ACF09H_29825 [Streptomyces sp. NPDC014983]|uniref:hypothetical protein n=1 Tax=Streptomyces sp. NPDC014983 TaxID=3364933 RepID=UPI0036F8E46F